MPTRCLLADTHPQYFCFIQQCCSQHLGKQLAHYWHRVTIDADEQNQWTDQDNMSRKGYVLLFCGAGGRGLGHWATPLTWQERLFKYMSCFPMCAIRTTTQQPLLVRSKGPLVFNWNNKRLGSDSLSPSAPLFLACVRQRWQHLLLIGNPHVS